MKNLEELTLSELLLARQYLLFYSNVTHLETEHVRNAAKTLSNLDKEIWAKLISNETPWGEVKPKSLKFEDEEFDKTLEDLSAGKI